VTDTPYIGIRPADIARIADDGALTLRGSRCENGDYATIAESFRCPRCFGEMHETAFAPAGTVWSFTTVLVPSPTRKPPYRIAYVDLDDGPRILCDVALDAPLRIGARVHVGVDGDMLRASLDEGAAA
jgi:uncharacterized protein